MAHQDYVVVFAGTVTEADQVKALLEGSGILAQELDEGMGVLAPWMVSGGGALAVRVAVPADQAELAEELLRGFEPHPEHPES